MRITGKKDGIVNSSFKETVLQDLIGLIGWIGWIGLVSYMIR